MMNIDTAAKLGNLNTLKQLVTRDNYNYPNMKDNDLYSPFELVCFYGHMHCITWFVDEFKIADLDDGFVIACKRGHIATIKYLLSIDNGLTDRTGIIYDCCFESCVLNCLLTTSTSISFETKQKTLYALFSTFQYKTQIYEPVYILLVHGARIINGETDLLFPPWALELQAKLDKSRHDCLKSTSALFYALRCNRVPKDLIRLILETRFINNWTRF